MEIALVAGICGCVGLAGVMMAAAALLKLSVNVTNRLVQPTKRESRGGMADWDWDDWDDEYEPGPRKRKAALPELGIGKGVMIVLLSGLVGGLGFLFLGFAAEGVGLRMSREDTKLAVAIVNMPLACLAMTVLLASTLPTNFWRAAMVTFVYCILFFAFVAAVGSVIFVFGVVFD
jgi:hypothetical protein